VADDIDQAVTHVVRGADLIDTTPLHISLFAALNASAPKYLHIPLAVSSPGYKLSKQQLAPPLDNNQALKNLKSALVFLGIQARQVSQITHIDTLIEWAIIHWRSEFLSSQTEILVSQTNGVYYIGN
jgi:glutamyl-Q tRNA(Asp) synthetase